MEFTVVANRFLHRMVRYLVGTMVDVARRRRPVGEMRALLDGTNPLIGTSPQTPPAGLFLRRVTYPARATTLRETAPAPPVAHAALDAPALLDSVSDRPSAGSADNS